jgi:hypothetical protein
MLTTYDFHSIEVNCLDLGAFTGSAFQQFRQQQISVAVTARTAGKP